jgi:thiopeptide-type bacteriocin biosynthesis protein
MRDTDWVSAHLFHRGDLDRLLTECVAPLVAELDTEVTGWFFLRYWEGGPHLRLRLRPRRPEHTEQIRQVVLEHGGRYLTAHPSPPAPYAREQYQATAARLATAERMASHDTLLRPDDTVEFIDYRPEYDCYGQPRALTAAEEHFVTSSTIALEVIRSGAPEQTRRAVALAMLMLTLTVCEPDLETFSGRLRALPHQPAPLHVGGAQVAALRQAYQRSRDALHQQARDLWARAGDGSLTGPLSVWLSSVRSLHDTLTIEHAAGRFAPTDTLSPLTRLVRAVESPPPAITHVLLRCAHLLCNRLGIHSNAEAQLATLVTRTLTEITQVV